MFAKRHYARAFSRSLLTFYAYDKIIFFNVDNENGTDIIHILSKNWQAIFVQVVNRRFVAQKTSIEALNLFIQN